MKARIIKTGEIIEGRLCTDGFAHIVNDAVVGMYSPFEYKIIAEELPMAELSTTEPDWNQIKIQASISAMQGMITGNYSNSSSCATIRDLAKKEKLLIPDVISQMAIEYAKSLVEELKKQTK